MPGNNRRDRLRAWTVYARDGTPLTEIKATAATMRETLPGVTLEPATGRAVMGAEPPWPWRTLAPAPEGGEYDAE